MVELGIEVGGRKSPNYVAPSNIPTAFTTIEISNTVVQITSVRITPRIAHYNSVAFVEQRLCRFKKRKLVMNVTKDF
jgi:hypothetical protein